MRNFSSLFVSGVDGPLFEVGSFVLVEGFLVGFVVLCGLVCPFPQGVGAGVCFGVSSEGFSDGYAEWWCRAGIVWVEASGGINGRYDVFVVVYGSGRRGVGSVNVGCQLSEVAG